MIQRTIENKIRDCFFRGKAILLYGARQTGKTTLSNVIIDEYRNDTLLITGDDSSSRSLLENASLERLVDIIGKNKIVFIDEAQKFHDIGLIIKLIVDHIKNVQVIATGSSAFELINRTAEPLTGRKYEFHLNPLSFEELKNHIGFFDERKKLEKRLVFGSYPEIVTHEGDEKELLSLLAGSYLYKDLLTLEQIKKPVLLEKILKAIALQVGSEVSYNEIAQLVSADKNTVEKYIDLLEKTFVIFRLSAFSRNIRNEIKKGRKIYFYDNGIRNAIIGDFKQIPLRSDVGPLWENYLVSERIKLLSTVNFYGSYYFWRTTQQQEIDYIEEIDGELLCVEFKWNPYKNVRIPKTFSQAYPNHDTMIVTPDNYEKFLLYTTLD